ncbi:aminopeptidase P family protein [Oscillatoria sp. CS-180]|uniref:aminopeptidase P family protein n=1 Tax=Oscillatoria sp. CS-180 TaxID=3021720 RepID=UPI00232FC0CD|nr:aminopeptidase P family protein [Oscillatoria sp. CS-180]MDB9529098.1 aminopeptidase P family protein [Oscillatoria sp. CS-180]
MTAIAPSPTLAETLRSRRERLAERINFPVMLWSGRPRARNFPANTYPFRANSHFLYFAGMSLTNAVIRLDGKRLTLFMDDSTVEDALWHGPMPTCVEVANIIGAEAALPMSELPKAAQNVATIPVQDGITVAEQMTLRTTVQPAQDKALAEAIVAVRLTHDAEAITEIRKAAAVSTWAHRAGMAATAVGQTEAAVRAVMESVIVATGMTCAYNSIVTIQGEVLHNERYDHVLQPGDLVLADVGAEAASGWASDITRTWPVTGQFSSTQRDIYEVVLAAHDACIAAARPGVEYRELHFLACRTLATGLAELGILKGDPDGLVEQDAHALFFPHGVGHLLGLDVHDMEDLGDLAGYASGRSRSDRFGLAFLRLDRPLQAGMAVTIEPGFYQVPGILQDAVRREAYSDCVDWDRLAQFQDVRGVRIEDDIFITAEGCEILTGELSSDVDTIETAVKSQKVM